MPADKEVAVATPSVGVVTMDRIMGQEDKSLYLLSKDFNSNVSKGNVQTKADVEETSTSASTPY